MALGERLSNHPDLVARHGPPSTMPIPAGGICFVTRACGIAVCPIRPRKLDP